MNCILGGDTMPKIIVTEEQWVQKGIEHFSKGGIESLVVEKMAKEFACSKSSFYWYFKDREAFIDQIVAMWAKQATSDVIYVSSGNMREEERVRTVLTMMFGNVQSGDFLLNFRKLAQKKVKYAEMLQSIETKRMDYMTELLQQLGMCEERAKIKSQFIYHYYLGWYERYKYAFITQDETDMQVQLVFKEIIYEG